MPKQRDSLRKQLARAIERFRKPDPWLALLRPLLTAPDQDYSDQRTRAIHATLALTPPDRHTDSTHSASIQMIRIIGDACWTNLQTSFSVSLHAVAVIQ
jgi:hypothetical protein